MKRVWLMWWSGSDYNQTYKDVKDLNRAWGLVKAMRKNLGSATWFRITDPKCKTP